jgi:hypothetical protein
MHDHDIRGIFRFQEMNTIGMGLPDVPEATLYLPFAHILKARVSADSKGLILYVMGGDQHLIARPKTIDRFFEEWSAWKEAHEGGL